MQCVTIINDHITSITKLVHWLPVEYIESNLSLVHMMVFKTLNDLSPLSKRTCTTTEPVELFKIMLYKTFCTNQDLIKKLMGIGRSA